MATGLFGKHFDYGSGLYQKLTAFSMALFQFISSGLRNWGVSFSFCFRCEKLIRSLMGKRHIHFPRATQFSPCTHFVYCERSATFTSCLPKFSPVNSPKNAFMVFSKPSTICSVYFSCPFFSHCANCRVPSSKRSA